MIFAYGLVDPDPSQPNGDITYHENRRGSRIISLQSYAEPPSEDKFIGLDTFEFRVNNVSNFLVLISILSMIVLHFRIQYQQMIRVIIVKYSKVQVDFLRKDMQ